MKVIFIVRCESVSLSNDRDHMIKRALCHCLTQNMELIQWNIRLYLVKPWPGHLDFMQVRTIFVIQLFMLRETWQNISIHWKYFRCLPGSRGLDTTSRGSGSDPRLTSPGTPASGTRGTSTWSPGPLPGRTGRATWWPTPTCSGGPSPVSGTGTFSTTTSRTSGESFSLISRLKELVKDKIAFLTVLTRRFYRLVSPALRWVIGVSVFLLLSINQTTHWGYRRN